MPNRWLTERRIMNFAHGGGLHEAPQGTLYAYKTALDRGANALEMDLHITRDGHVVTMHDSTVDRTTDGTGCVATKTLAELKALDAAHTFVPSRGPVRGLDPGDYPMRGIATGDVAPPAGFTASDFTVATLEEVFQAQPEALMLMELKPTEVYAPHDCPSEVAALPPGERPDLASEVARLIATYGMTDKVMVASFIDEMLFHFMDLAPDVDTSFPFNESVSLYVAYSSGQPLPNPRGHEAIQVPRSFGSIVITEDLVRWSRDNGVAVHFWTINDPDEMTELLEWGADGLITDRPSVLAALLPDPVDPDPDPGGPDPVDPETPTTTSTRPGATSPTTPDPSGPTSTSTTLDGGPGSTSTTSSADPGGPSATSAPGGTGGVGSGGGTGSGTGPSAGAGPLPRTGSGLAPAWLALGLLAAGSAILFARKRSVSHTTR